MYVRVGMYLERECVCVCVFRVSVCVLDCLVCFGVPAWVRACACVIAVRIFCIRL